MMLCLGRTRARSRWRWLRGGYPCLGGRFVGGLRSGLILGSMRPRSGGIKRGRGRGRVGLEVLRLGLGLSRRVLPRIGLWISQMILQLPLWWKRRPWGLLMRYQVLIRYLALLISPRLLDLLRLPLSLRELCKPSTFSATPDHPPSRLPRLQWLGTRPHYHVKRFSSSCYHTAFLLSSLFFSIYSGLNTDFL